MKIVRVLVEMCGALLALVVFLASAGVVVGAALLRPFTPYPIHAGAAFGAFSALFCVTLAFLLGVAMDTVFTARGDTDEDDGPDGSEDEVDEDEEEDEHAQVHLPTARPTAPAPAPTTAPVIPVEEPSPASLPRVAAITLVGRFGSALPVSSIAFYSPGGRFLGGWVVPARSSREN